MTYLRRLPSGTRTRTPEEAVESMLDAAGDREPYRSAVVEAAIAVYGREVVDRVLDRREQT